MCSLSLSRHAHVYEHATSWLIYEQRTSQLLQAIIPYTTLAPDKDFTVGINGPISWNRDNYRILWQEIGTEYVIKYGIRYMSEIVLFEGCTQEHNDWGRIQLIESSAKQHKQMADSHDNLRRKQLLGLVVRIRVGWKYMYVMGNWNCKSHFPHIVQFTSCTWLSVMVRECLGRHVSANWTYHLSKILLVHVP